MSEIKFRTCYGIKKYEAADMDKEKFEEIREERDTPSFVKINNEEAYFNEYTCIQSTRYGGSCECASHPTKRWVKFNPETGEMILNK